MLTLLKGFCLAYPSQAVILSHPTPKTAGKPALFYALAPLGLFSCASHRLIPPPPPHYEWFPPSWLAAASAGGVAGGKCPLIRSAHSVGESSALPPTSALSSAPARPARWGLRPHSPELEWGSAPFPNPRWGSAPDPVRHPAPPTF